jgi:RimJ/RimL family protein N-acetyltransferase
MTVQNPRGDEVALRDVADEDVALFYQHQRDPDAAEMAAFTSRDRDAHAAHWTTIRADDTVLTRTILFQGRVAGNVVSWERDGKRVVGYWIDKSHWGRGIATAALCEFVAIDRARPLYAYVARANTGSIRVLEKCGFTVFDEPPPGPDGIEEFLMKLEGR